MADTTTEDITWMLGEMLAGAVGGTADHWRRLAGPVEQLPIAMNPHSNWRIAPAAVGEELRAIETAAELVRAEHPYVVPPPPLTR